MRTKEYIQQKFMEKSRILQALKLRESDIQELIQDYHDAVNETLLENGYVQVSENFKIEIVRLKKRKHVLRGQSYYNHRRYKIKVKTDYDYYEKVAKSFDSLLEDTYEL